jgi:tRNA(Ile)-lysidine synthase
VDIKALAADSGLGLEETGRKVRYSFLERIRQTQNADWIVTGHHLGDLAEDILLRLIRGTAWPGLGGMKAKTDNRILRPLLLVDKRDLLRLLQSLHIDWQEDESNQDTSFRRNRIRKEIIPVLLEENPALEIYNYLIHCQML